MRQDILAGLQREVYRRCQSESNRFGMGCYDHIAAVVRHGALLAERCGADKEIVLIAAWLHDIASITDYSLYELHHIRVRTRERPAYKQHPGGGLCDGRGRHFSF